MKICALRNLQHPVLTLWWFGKHDDGVCHRFVPSNANICAPRVQIVADVKYEAEFRVVGPSEYHFWMALCIETMICNEGTILKFSIVVL